MGVSLEKVAALVCYSTTQRFNFRRDIFNPTTRRTLYRLLKSSGGKILLGETLFSMKRR